MEDRIDERVSPNELVRVDSCLDLPRADLARMALAKEEISTSLENAHFLSWFWHYSNAVGGVPIYVRRCDAERARGVLAAARARLTESLPPWTCLSCGQRVAGQWNACWQCGHWADGTQGSPVGDDSAAQPEDHTEIVAWWNVPRVFVVAASALSVILLLKLGLTLPLMIAPFAFVVYFLLQQFEPASDGQPEPQAAAEPSDGYSPHLSATRSEVSRATVRRAWHAGVFGILVFPPLGFYSMRLLWKLSHRDVPLSLADTWRCLAVFFFNIATIAFCLAFLGMLLSAFIDVLR